AATSTSTATGATTPAMRSPPTRSAPAASPDASSRPAGPNASTPRRRRGEPPPDGASFPGSPGGAHYRWPRERSWPGKPGRSSLRRGGGVGGSRAELDDLREPGRALAADPRPRRRTTPAGSGTTERRSPVRAGARPAAPDTGAGHGPRAGGVRDGRRDGPGPRARRRRPRRG